MVVLDACGVGALPDAADYGDAATDTLGHLAEAQGGLRLPTLQRLGLGSIVDLLGVPPSPGPVLHGRLHPLGPGKDSTAGHWELMGVVAATPAPTYPHGFPDQVVAALSAAMGRRVICNAAYNGIAAIADFGTEHLRSGDLILYTSQDSVLQLAAHVDRVSPQALYGACAAARAVMDGPHAVGRVIARPFTGAAGAFQRTPGRKDFALVPPTRSHLQELGDAGVAVHTVGKVSDLFAGVGIDVAHPAPTNATAIAAVSTLLGELEPKLVFANLVDTDQVHGHRHDADGFHAALRVIDTAVAGWLGLLGSGDLLILTADHGCDVTTPGFDHTREYAPLLALFAGHGTRRHDGPLADVGASVLRWLTGHDAPDLPGSSFVE